MLYAIQLDQYKHITKPLLTVAGVVISQETGSRLPKQDGGDGESGSQLGTRPEEPARGVHTDAGVCGGLQ